MRDDHRPKQELIHEITGLRKQVGDLREAMTARRRVEDALRGNAALLRNLTDGAPFGLGLFRPDGTLLTSNQRFARMLGYQSPAELQSLSAVLGVFASPEDQARALQSFCPGEPPRRTLFRGKNGCRLPHGVLPGPEVDGNAIVLAIFQDITNLSPSSFPVPSA
jgi:PAS domain S-box-containing protein